MSADYCQQGSFYWRIFKVRICFNLNTLGFQHNLVFHVQNHLTKNIEIFENESPLSNLSSQSGQLTGDRESI